MNLVILPLILFVTCLEINYSYGFNDTLNSFIQDNRTETGKFNYPDDIISGKTGEIYVADSNNHRIQKFSNDGKFIIDWKVNDTACEPKPYDNRLKFSMDSLDNLYIIGTCDFLVKKFSKEGTFVGGIDRDNTSYKFQSFNVPAITIGSDDSIYLVDGYEKNFTIVKFSKNFTLVDRWKINPDFYFITDLVSDDKNNLYLTSYNNDTVLKYSQDGTFLNKWRTSNDTVNVVNGPLSIVHDPHGFIYVLTGWDQVLKYSTDGTELDLIRGEDKFDNNRRSGFSALTIDQSGNIFTTNSYSNRIQKFSSNGSFVTSWGNNYNDQFFYIKKVIKMNDANNNIYVVDDWTANDTNTFNLIKKFSKDGILIDSWKLPNYSPNSWKSFDIQDITSDKTGENLYVLIKTSGYHNDDDNLIRNFSNNGTLIDSWGREGHNQTDLQYPVSMAIDKDENLYILNSEPIYGDRKGISGVHQIKQFSNNGSFLTSWGSVGDYDGKKIQPVTEIDVFKNPVAVNVDYDKNIYVLDKGIDEDNPVILKFTNNGNLISKISIPLLLEKESYVLPLIMIDAANSFYIYSTPSFASSEPPRILKFDDKGRVTEILYIDNDDYEFGYYYSPSFSNFIVLPDSIILANYHEIMRYIK